MRRANKPKTKGKVMMALSGGIDSAVSAALLLEQGYQVEGAFMKNWSSTEGLVKADCPWIEDRRVALKVAAFLGIPLHTFDFEKQYTKNVMEYFFTEYKAGRTPNPDVMCNKEIKFKILYDKALKMGFDFLATGHYAQIKNGELHRSKDEFKDQTYFVYNLKKPQLKHILFPIGGYKKNQVKKIAEKLKLPNAGRKESMGLCFVGKVELEKFLAQKIKPQKGKILTTDGNLIGQHNGVAFYTIGQRHGLNVGAGGPWYVVEKKIKQNQLIVTNHPENEEFEIREIKISNINWITEPKKFPFKCEGRFRHQQKLIRLKIDKNKVVFDKPQRMIASGQSLVLYSGKVCLGGGVIV